MVKLLFFAFRVTNSRSKDKKFHFVLLTRLANSYIFLKKVALRVTDWMSKNKNLHFELLTRKLNFSFFTFEFRTRS